jgi:hypothetical protein
MKPFVGDDWGLVVLISVATLVVAAITGANETATFLIALGFGAIAIARWRIQDGSEGAAK